MRLPLTLFLGGLLGLLTGGCATLGEGDCRYADWFELGRRDGARGQAWQQLVRHNTSCSEYGVQVDEERYRSGRDAGLRQYCTPVSGWERGLRGAGYRQVCPAHLEGAFLDGFELGHEIHRVRPEIERYKRETRKREDELAKDGLDADRRREILHQLHELIEHRVEAERHLAHLEAAAHERGFLP